MGDLDRPLSTEDYLSDETQARLVFARLLVQIQLTISEENKDESESSTDQVVSQRRRKNVVFIIDDFTRHFSLPENIAIELVQKLFTTLDEEQSLVLFTRPGHLTNLEWTSTVPL